MNAEIEKYTIDLYENPDDKTSFCLTIPGGMQITGEGKSFIESFKLAVLEFIRNETTSFNFEDGFINKVENIKIHFDDEVYSADKKNFVNYKHLTFWVVGFDFVKTFEWK